jgi:hypothetical protein
MDNDELTLELGIAFSQVMSQAPPAPILSDRTNRSRSTTFMRKPKTPNRSRSETQFLRPNFELKTQTKSFVQPYYVMKYDPMSQTIQSQAANQLTYRA